MQALKSRVQARTAAWHLAWYYGGANLAVPWRKMRRTGTWGYVPPEGFEGRYTTASDVYQVPGGAGRWTEKCLDKTEGEKAVEDCGDS